jgi:hypothetical protein
MGHPQGFFGRVSLSRPKLSNEQTVCLWGGPAPNSGYSSRWEHNQSDFVACPCQFVPAGRIEIDNRACDRRIGVVYRHAHPLYSVPVHDDAPLFCIDRRVGEVQYQARRVGQICDVRNDWSGEGELQSHVAPTAYNLHVLDRCRLVSFLGGTQRGQQEQETQFCDLCDQSHV